jgi:glycosyltransferase involved in cell wall biosynthesis
MKPLVSVLIPCFNAEKWLTQTIESVLNQTWKNIEIIIVDDGSSDNSFTIAKSFESDKIKVISQVNSGASAARNRAFQESQGDFIQYLDADDLLAPDKIERQVNLLSDSNFDCIASGEWARFYTNYSEAEFKPDLLWRDLAPIEWLICAWENHLMMHPAAWLVPRKICQQAGNWNESLSLNDDGEYFCRVVLASLEVKFCRGAKSYYRSGISGSLSNILSPLALNSAFYSLELCTHHLLERENIPRSRYACATLYQRFIYDIYPRCKVLEQKAQAKVKQLGGTDLKPTGSPKFKLFSQLFGWKIAKRMQDIFYSINYS